MAGNASVVEQAETLATPSAYKPDDEIFDLDAGDSLLDQKPDDGQDIGDDADKPAKEVPAKK